MLIEEVEEECYSEAGTLRLVEFRNDGGAIEGQVRLVVGSLVGLWLGEESKVEPRVRIVYSKFEKHDGGKLLADS